MPTFSDDERLRQIGAELKALFSRIENSPVPNPILRYPISALLREAISLGAFLGDEWAEFRGQTQGVPNLGDDALYALIVASPIVSKRIGKTIDNVQDVYDCIVGEVTTAASRRKRPDGPCEPDIFYWQGLKYDPIPRGPFKVLNAIWQNEDRCIESFEIASALGDAEEILADNAIASIRGELNDFFREHEIPLHAVVRGPRLSIKEGAPKVRTKKLP